MLGLLLFLGVSEASCGAGAQSVTVKPTGCGFDPQGDRGAEIFT